MKSILLDNNTERYSTISNSEQPKKLLENINCFRLDTTNASIFEASNSVSSVKMERLENNAANKKISYDIIALERLIYRLISEGNISETRNTLEKYCGYSSSLLDKWRKAFSKPPARGKAKATLEKNEISNDAKVINNLRSQYAAQWIAIKSGEIIASNQDLRELKKELEHYNKSDQLTFLKL
ncbi:MAG: DUF5678 domain-containing protein [Desulforhopalus sp.]|nr:DUF5678 domain-containing protein [Desulforhopalus sp.]